MHSRFNEQMRDGFVKCTASENLVIAVVMRYFVEEELAGIASIAKERDSFLACCDVVQFVQQIKRQPQRVTIDMTLELQTKTSEHLRLHKLAYGTALIVPKHHLNFHTSAQILADRQVLDMFVIERHHNAIKSVTEPIDNTTQFEKAVLRAATTQQLHRLENAEEAFEQYALLRPLADYAPGVKASKKMCSLGTLVTAGDVIDNGSEAGEVLAFLQDRSGTYAMVHDFELVEIRHFGKKFRRKGHYTLIPAAGFKLFSARFDTEDHELWALW